MKTKLTLAIAALAAIFTSAVIMSAASTPQAYAQDRCESSTSKSGGTAIQCDLTHQESQTAKKQCQSGQFGDLKCSSSQTGFGDFGNIRKEHGNVKPPK